MLRYLRYSEEDEFELIKDMRPFKTLLILDKGTEGSWRVSVIEGLIISGCVHIISYGEDSEKWDKCVDFANLELSYFQDVLEEDCISTSFHQAKNLHDFFQLSKFASYHPTINPRNTLILHVGDEDREEEFRAAYTLRRSSPD